MADEIPPLPPGAVLMDDPGRTPAIPPLPPGAVLMPSPGAPKPPERERGFDLSLLSEGVSNLPASMIKAVTDTASGLKEAVTSPVQTAKTLGKLALTASPINETIIGGLVRMVSPHLDEGQRKKLGETLADLYGPKKALVDDYANTYGSKQKFLKTVATDPARVLTDLATIATGGEAALARLPGAAGRVGSAVARGAQMLDPVNVGAAAIGAAGRAIPRALDISTNVGEGPMREALRAGVEGGQAATDFRAAIRGGADPETLVDMAHQNIGAMRQDMFADYAAAKTQWAGANQPQLGFNEITNAQRRAINQISSGSGSTLRFKVNNSDLRRINTLFDVVEEWRRDPSSWTIEGLDDLKQRLRNEVDWRADKPSMHRAAQTIIEGVRQQLLRNAPPEYMPAMRAYTEASRELENMERSFSLGRNASAETSLRKLQSVMRNNANTNYGMRQNMARRMVEGGGRDVFPAMAGHALSSWAPRGIARGVISGGLPASAGALAAAGALTLPAAMGMAAGAASTSPRIMGNMMYGAGAAARPFNRAWSALNPTTQSILRGALSQPARNAYTNLDRMEDEPSYADGGSVDGGLSLGLPPGDATIGLNNLIANLRRNRSLPPQQRPAPLPEAPLPDLSEKSPPSEVEQLLGYAGKLWDEHVGETRAKKLEGLLDILKKTGSEPLVPAAAASGTEQPPVETDPAAGLAPDEARYLGQTATDESSNNTQVTHPGSGAHGLYQFLPGTWADVIKRHPGLGLTMENLYEKDPKKAADYHRRAMKAFTSDNVAHFTSTMGRKPRAGEMYVMHMLGPAGGVRLAQGADKPLSEVVDAGALRGNPGLAKFRTAADALTYYNRRFG